MSVTGGLDLTQQTCVLLEQPREKQYKYVTENSYLKTEIMLVNKKCDKINMINSSKSLILFNQIQLTLSSIYHFSNSSHLCSYTACSSLSLEENHCYF